MMAAAHLLVGLVNTLYSDGAVDDRLLRVPSLPQRRVQDRPWAAAHDFFGAGSAWPELSAIQAFLLHSDGYRPRGSVAEPLDERGGVPPAAAQVPLALHFPKIADQVRRPQALLLPPSPRPAAIGKHCTLVSSGYPQLVARANACGLQRLVAPNRVWKHRGRRLVGGIFAVPNGEGEQRVISDVAVNDLVDPAKVIRPAFAYPPRLRVMRTDKRRPIRVRKRDLRHCLHMLRPGRRWPKFFAHPSVSNRPDRVLYPLHVAVPMGFTGSPGWAQAAADTIFLSGRLPQERRVTFERPCPVAPPVWGSIIDDLWAIDQPPGPISSSAARRWMLRAEAQWDRQSIPVHRQVDRRGDRGRGAGRPN